MGYIGKNITKSEIGNVKYLEINLEADALYLAEVTVLPGVNPAHRIINLVIDNADRNNPEKMRSFSYVSYNKMYFTIAGWLSNINNLGEALGETNYWYKDWDYSPNTTYPWFIRGGSLDWGVGSGGFNFTGQSGTTNAYSFRTIVTTS